MYTKRRRKPNRWAEFDYNSPAFYFITICTAKSKLFFGKIENDKMILNKFGQIAHDCWVEIVDHFDDVELDEFVVMPNHVHGIVVNKKYGGGAGDGGNDGNRHACSVPIAVGNGHTHSSSQDNPSKKSRINRSRQKLPKIIGSYKSAVSRKINKLGINIKFGWHKSYYDHIIRNEKAYYNIRQYIIDNPKKWHRDRNNIF